MPQPPSDFTPIDSPTLVDLLRSTLKRLEEAPGIDPNDPKLREFKNSILRSIAELEVRRKTDAA